MSNTVGLETAIKDLELLEDAIREDQPEEAGNLIQKFLENGLAGGNKWGLGTSRCLQREGPCYWTILCVAKSAVESEAKGSKNLESVTAHRPVLESFRE